MNIPVWIEFILSLGIFFAGMGYLYGQFRDGHNKAKIDSITILEADVKTLQNKVQELTEKVNTLTKEIELKDQKLAETLAILQGRDPAMADFIKAGMLYMKETLPVVRKMDNFLSTIK